MGFFAAVSSYLSTRVAEWIATRWGVVDRPVGGRKIHTRAVPLWGGLGIAVTIGGAVAYGMQIGLFEGIRPAQLVGFCAGIAILLVGGLLDDWRPLPPRVQILFPIAAAIVVIASGTGIVQVTHPATQRGVSLVWWHVAGLSLPSDLLTFIWLVAVTYATKILDGLDGLVAGLTVIGAGLVGGLALSSAYYQPNVAVLSSIVGGAFFGFLPRNVHPAKQFLGEAGSTIAGFSLGVLAILGSVKIAVALAVLTIPLTDVLLVVIDRTRRGVPWWKGDNTHLHFRLLRAGLSHRATVFLLWGISLLSGLLALSLQTRGKFFLIAALVVCTAIASFWAGKKANA